MVERDEVSGFLMSSGIDLVAQYLQSGREHERLSLDQLRSKWITAFKDMTRYPADKALCNACSGLDAEFKLRNVTPPFDLVQAEVDAYIAEMHRFIQETKQYDPARYAQIIADTEKKLTEHQKAKSSGN